MIVDIISVVIYNWGYLLSYAVYYVILYSLSNNTEFCAVPVMETAL